ncbi:MAG: creatininase [Chloroflexota bacterium]
MEKTDRVRTAAMAELAWPEVRDAIAGGYGVAVAVGATEQHGPHLPLNTDVVLPFDVLMRVAERHRVLVAPPIAYGYKSRPLSGGGQGFPGTTSLRARTLMDTLEDIVVEFMRQGFRQIMVMNWHYENAGVLYEAIDLALERRRDISNARVVLVENPFPVFDAPTMEVLFPHGFPGWDVEHASVLETSLMLALYPERVLVDRIRDDAALRHPPYDVLPGPEDFVPRSGVLSRATEGSAEKGHLVLRLLVEHITEIWETEFAR